MNVFIVMSACLVVSPLCIEEDPLYEGVATPD